jgi:hypothetical protein
LGSSPFGRESPKKGLEEEAGPTEAIYGPERIQTEQEYINGVIK